MFVNQYLTASHKQRIKFYKWSPPAHPHHGLQNLETQLVNCTEQIKAIILVFLCLVFISKTPVLHNKRNGKYLTTPIPIRTLLTSQQETLLFPGSVGWVMVNPGQLLLQR